MRLKRVSRGSHAPSPDSNGSTKSSDREPTLSVEQIITLSPESVAALLAAPVDDVPGSLEALFHEVADDALPDWQSVSVAQAEAAEPAETDESQSTSSSVPLRLRPIRPPASEPAAEEAHALIRASGFPAATGPEPEAAGDGDEDSSSRLRESVAPVSTSVLLHVDGDGRRDEAPRRRRRLATAAMYAAGLFGAAVLGAWATGQWGQTGPTQVSSLATEADRAAGSMVGAAVDPGREAPSPGAGAQTEGALPAAAPPGDEPATAGTGEPWATAAGKVPGVGHGRVPTAVTAPEKEPETATDAGAESGSDGQPAELAEAGLEDELLPDEQGASSSEEEAAPAEPTVPPFNPALASQALGTAMGTAAACPRQGSSKRLVPVAVSFAPSGRVTSALVTGGAWAGTPTGGCVAQAFRNLAMAPFAGGPVTVTKTVRLQ